MADTAPVGAEQKKSLTLLHISDLHFGQARGDGHIHFDQQKVVCELVKDAAKMAATLGAPDLILVTGDLAFSAKKEQYEQAAAWLEALAKAVDVEKDRVWLVPGNHDVDREVAAKSRTRKGVHEILRSVPHNLDDFLMSDAMDDFESNLWPKFRPFAEFARGYASPVLSAAEPFWERRASSGLGDILVLGLNSCLLSLDNTDAKANLALSKAQLTALLRNVAEKTLILALAHHPPEWLSDGNELTKELVKYPHLLFSGHVHEPGGGIVHALGARALARVNAGAGHGSQGEGRHAYSWLQLSPAGLVWHPRAYHEKWNEFRADGDRLEEGDTSQTLTLAKLPDPLARWLGGKVPPTQSSITPPPPSFDGLEAYLKAVCAQHQKLPLIGVNPELKLSLDIDEVYVSLRASVNRDLYHRQKWKGAESPDCEESEDVELSQAFTCASASGRRGLIILGDPGSGKTTLLKLLLVHCILHGPEYLGLPPGTVPVMLPLRELKNDRNIDAFMTRLLEQDTQLSLPPDFPRTLRQSRPLVYLLDGLDEVPDENERARVSKWIRAALATHTNACFAVTSRYARYQGEARLDDHFLELNVRPLREAEAQRLVGNFYRIVETYQAQKGRPTLDKVGIHVSEVSGKVKADHLCSLLESETYRTRRLRELHTNPLLLTIICLIHQRYNCLPAARWRLYEQCVDTLLWHWQKAKGQKPPSETLDQAYRLLRPLAWWLHQREQRRHASSAELVGALRPTFLELGTGEEKMGQLWNDLRDRSGLLAGWDADSYGFIHVAFQEHLSAVHLKLASGESPVLLEELASHFGESWWSEVILLLVSLPDPCLFEPFMEKVLATDGFSTHGNRQLLMDCVSDAAVKSARPFLHVALNVKRHEGVRYAALSALRGFKDEQRAEVIAACRILQKAPERELRELARELLAARGEKVAVALEAGTVWTHPSTGLEFVYVPAGSFRMGSDQRDVEKPPHNVTFARGFWIGKYPVTNEQYERFLEANRGYKRPGHWEDREWNGPRQPVVGVTWADVMAYKQWASGMLRLSGEFPPADGDAILLPSEAMWEYSARGPEGRKYPWGETEPTPELASFGQRAGKTTPVGQHPKGASWVGALDMAGNVWEWCADVWHDNHQGAPEDGSPWMRNNLSGGDAGRVLRGGSWGSNPGSLRGACRLRRITSYHTFDLGFRLCLGPVSAEYG